MSDKRKRFKFRSFADNEFDRQMDLLNNRPIIERIDEDYIDIGNKQWESKYYEKCLNIYDREDITQCCINYITGLKWTFDYYYKGCSNWTWKYNYRHGPSLKDLSDVINNIDINTIKLKKNKPFNVIVQLLSIFPYNSKELIPEKFRCLMESDSDITDYYPIEFELDCYYKRYFGCVTCYQ